MISVGYWMDLSREVNLQKNLLLTTHKKRNIQPTLFANKLCDGMLALFTIHCIEQYIKHGEGKNYKKFASMFDVLCSF